MKRISILLLVLLAVPAYAQIGSMRLLAVSEADNETGSVADLQLEIKEGTGRVFIDSFPLTKIDTQISTRFAKEIACDMSDRDCSRLDFFYTIRANSAIVGGPSAGAAITVLTSSMLDGLDLNDDASITGTINSGGVIGPVGGILAKIRAAAKNNLTLVVIPKWVDVNDSEIQKVAQEHNIQVHKASSLKEAMFYLTGKQYEKDKKLIINSFYLDTMEQISSGLCEETTRLVLDENTTLANEAQGLYEKGRTSLEKGEFYSAASYCFGANVKYRYTRFLAESLTEKEIIDKANEIGERVKEYKRFNSQKKIETITDLQAYIIVNQRLVEAEGHLTDSLSNLGENRTNSSLYSLSFAMERLNSAYSWASFFGKEGERYVIDKESLHESCINKISEAEERIQYLEALIRTSLDEKELDIKRAYQYYTDEDYDLCLFQASLVKAEVDTILNNMGIGEEMVDEVIQDRLQIAEDILAEQDEKGAFPILGYSYFEYAKSLAGSDTYSSLLYIEYATELSKLDMYFEEKRIVLPRIDVKLILVFFLGLSIGFLLSYQWLKRVFIGKRRRR